ncbi:MAG: sigma-54 dependent transcriptional regulator [Candidatus Margulisbacteria bacterium]|nr:sigma-54 dependent transcriptional regulator [Candidatus Margulisiibacteriota bacterium]
MPNILIVDDEPSIRESFSLILEGTYNLFLAASGEAALKIATDQKIDLAYLDIRMPGRDGLETLKGLKVIDPDLEIIMVTAVNDVSKASEAVSYGAKDYVVKPFDVNHILKLSEQTLRKKGLLAAGTAAQQQAGQQTFQLVGQAEKIISLARAIEKLSSDQPVLILGEPGTEKETVARLIHKNSSRAANSFKAVPLSPTLSLQQMKALFFGFGQGDNTAALEAKSGLFEQAKSGSIFISNLEAFPEEILKTILKQQFSRQGRSTSIPIEARLIGAATTATADNKAVFDFFSKITLQIPPLRERLSDIPLLANDFVNKYNHQLGKDVKIEPRAIDALTNYSWPGNVLQLENLLERLILLSTTGQITLEQLPIDILLASGQPAAGLLDSFEKKYIQAIYTKLGKNKDKAAAVLGLNPFLLESKI